ncbi:bacillithiol biosynthesis cysteine-adding enzyme BshC [Alkalicoccus saliphilus]|uniref:Putative cysteine ligase BshC n=1 Tax=Alkalicoccus saliphilus TaxID=200989 RepID=A0A2T4U8K2_9BACI|nr:bacillithiol biosynthesis cysteine-adding enzyme BshC [Alkalicoccus saliphilus]PTL39719.1 bacillithiol biosynthesis cysteine-adding enzyme BshC [Alkalicoccus saliphilus]
MELKKTRLFEPDTYAGRYLNADSEIISFYDYQLNETQERADELDKLTFNRDKVVSALQSFQRRSFPCEQALFQTERLLQEDSVAVVGGQQAGLLTGPLYTIHKIVSIISESRRLERELERPVIPVFWIAGEDHDIDEINHTFFHDKNNISKIKIKERNDIKTPASERIINKEAALEAVYEALKSMPETSETQEIKKGLLDDIKKDLTYTEWCAEVLYRLFKGSGLVVMDAHDPEIREIEKEYFSEMVRNNTTMRRAFSSQAEKMYEKGFGEPIAIDPNNAHLFIEENNQRYLLQSDGSRWWKKGEDHLWNEEEISAALIKKGGLSNNVVSRPVMQDLILPVHTFIAGAGELHYWGTLKEVFHSFGHRMPLVKPRHSITFVSRKSEKTLNQYGINLKDVINRGTKEIRQKRLEDADGAHSEKLIENVESKVSEELQLLLEMGGSQRTREQLHERYMKKWKKLMEDYRKDYNKALEEEEAVHLKRLEALEAEIFPEKNKQERFLNIHPFLNNYGNDLVERLTQNVVKQDNGEPSHFTAYL